MSIRVMGDVFYLNPKEVDAPTKAVLLALADHANDDGLSVYPSVKRIAWKTSLSERTVRTKLKLLREQGFIKIEKLSKVHKANEYSMDIDKIITDMHRGAVDSGLKIHGVPDRPATVAPLKGESCTPRPATVAPNTLSKTSKETLVVESEILSSKKQAKPKPTPPTPSPKITWLTAYNDVHVAELGGDMNMGQAGREFKKLEAKHERDDVIKGWQRHCKEQKQYASPSAFASKPLLWIKKASTSPASIPAGHIWR